MLHIARDLFIKLLSRRERQAFFMLMGGTLLYSAFEIGGIGFLFFYMKMLMDPLNAARESLDVYLPFVASMPKDNLLLAASATLLGFYVLRFMFMTLFSYLSLKFSRHLFARLTADIFKKVISQPLNQFYQVNSAQYKQVLVAECNNVVGVVQQLLIFFAETLTILFIFALMLGTNAGVTLSVFCLALFTVVLQTRIINPRLSRMSQQKTELLTAIYRVLDETFGNYKLLKINCKEYYAEKNFTKIFAPYNSIQVNYQLAQSVPKGIVEVFGVAAIVSVAIVGILQGRLDQVVPTLTFFALAFIRVLPSANRINTALSAILFNEKSVSLVQDYLAIQEEGLATKANPVHFDNDITLEDIEFSYNGKIKVLDSFSYRIPKGRKIGIVGPSGAGKSTLADIVMGLVRPNGGALRVDGVSIRDSNVRSWRARIGYIPQNIYLFDGTVAENVCMGYEYDDEKIERALKRARIFDTIMEKGGLNLLVGEQGNQLSGGQRQRIAIARALYNDPDVLIMDEGTSALDDRKEQEIMDSIFDLAQDKTVLIIAHRQHTLARCDDIIQLQG